MSFFYVLVLMLILQQRILCLMLVKDIKKREGIFLSFWINWIKLFLSTCYQNLHNGECFQFLCRNIGIFMLKNKEKTITHKKLCMGTLHAHFIKKITLQFVVIESSPKHSLTLFCYSKYLKEFLQKIFRQAIHNNLFAYDY